jgi:CRP-like cAMP-binding protein
MAFLGKGKRCASVVADTPSNIIEIRKGAVTGDIAATLYGNIARLLSDRLAEANLIMSLSLESRTSHMDTGTFMAVKNTIRKSS